MPKQRLAILEAAKVLTEQQKANLPIAMKTLVQDKVRELELRAKV